MRLSRHEKGRQGELRLYTHIMAIASINRPDHDGYCLQGKVGAAPGSPSVNGSALRVDDAQDGTYDEPAEFAPVAGDRRVDDDC